MIVYVDDIIVTSNNISLIKKLVSHLNFAFNIKELSVIDYFFGFMSKLSRMCLSSLLKRYT